MGRMILFGALAGLLAAGCSSAPKHPPLDTVDYVEVEKYMGKWFEIARLPMWFQRGCIDSTAEYELMESGEVSVLNSCSTEKGKAREARGVAKIVDAQTNARLQVSFGGWIGRIFMRSGEGNYWIIYLEPDYSAAIVATPNRKNLWILSRRSEMDDAQYSRLVDFCREKGFDTSKLIRNRRPLIQPERPQ